MTALCYRNYVVDSRTIAILTNCFQVPSLLRYTHTFSSFPNISLIVHIFHALLKDYSIRAQKSDPIVTTGSLYQHYYHPIVQALAPYVIAGCCTVNGLVPRVLFMVSSS